MRSTVRVLTPAIVLVAAFLVAPPSALATPAISIADVSVVEGNSGSTTMAVFAVTLSEPGSGTSVIYTTADGTAIAPGDYTATSGTLTIVDGQSSGTISVPVIGDTVFELDETFVVNLSVPVGATLADAQAVGTITNDDELLCTVEGTSGPDPELKGTDGDDVICGYQGHDTIDGMGGNDIVYGNMGKDVLVGGEGNDALFGGNGKDRLSDAAGSDALFGGNGKDSLNSVDAVSVAGSANDTNDGGNGTDTCEADPGDVVTSCR